MDIFLNVIILVLGFVMLVKGADYFVDGAAGISGKLKVPELVIGLTVVAFGTSAPELSVSISSAIKGSAELTIGNVIGSNIVNIILILGVSSLVRPLPVSKSSLKFDLPFLLFSSALFVIFGAIGNEIGRAEGIIMFLLLIAYIAFLVVTALKDRKKTLELGIEVEEEEEAPKGRIGEWYKRMCEKTWFLIIITVVGLAFVIVGADFVVDSSTFIAEKLNIDKRIIGLTVVAVGTSLPGARDFGHGGGEGKDGYSRRQYHREQYFQHSLRGWAEFGYNSSFIFGRICNRRIDRARMRRASGCFIVSSRA